MESVTRSVALLWRPARYAARWAYAPEEVPAFDPSRGGDPFAVVVDLDYVRFVEQDLGGGEEPPGLEGELDVELGDSGDVTTVPVPNYPRLVRIQQQDVGERRGDNNPLEHIAALAAHREEAEFMTAARRVAEAYGPLSYALVDFSLHIWRHAAQELQVHLLLLRRLLDIRKYGEGSDERDVPVEPVEKEILRELLELLDPELANPRPYEVAAIIDASKSLHCLRIELAGLYWREFGRHLRTHRHKGGYLETTRALPAARKLLVDVGSPGQIIVRCGSLGWSFYQLWRLASEVDDIRLCEGCGRLFQPRRRDARHCSATCRVASHRRRIKNTS